MRRCLAYRLDVFGPRPNGFWSAHHRQARGVLELDRTYRVVRPFVDHDRVTHPVGETWTFVGSAFAPYDDGLSLFVQTAEGEWHIRLHLFPGDEQARVWDDFAAYVQVVDGQGTSEPEPPQ